VSEFAIGEVAIYVRSGSPHYGEEVTILSTLIWWPPGGTDHMGVEANLGGYAYEITPLEAIPGPWIARSSWLKKKDNPKTGRECDRVVSWDDCAWKPKELAHHE